MSVRDALKEGDALVSEVRRGKQALRRGDGRKVAESAQVRIVDSLDLDAATRNAFAREKRWDYLLGTSHGGLPLIAVEVHPANTGEARVVIEKKRAAEALLRSRLKPAVRVRGWFWVASGGTKISPNTPQAKLLEANGVRLVGNHLDLEHEL